MAMHWLNKLFWWRTPPKDETEDLEKIMARWESSIISLQSVLIWERPYVSLTYFAAVNLVFWSIVWLECRLYGLIFFTLFAAAVMDYLRYQGLLGACRAPAAQPNCKVLTVEELCSCLRTVHERVQSVCTRMRALRENQPAMFCLITCGCCLLLAVIGRAVSGASIIYVLLLAVFSIPALCVRYPEYWQMICNCMSHGMAMDEYLPDSSDDTIRILNLVEEQPCSLDYQSPGEAQLYPDLSSMPSCENSLDGFLDPDVELPSPRNVDEDLSDTSDISEPIEIKFKSKHFNGDGSSTSSGDDLSKGLRFRGKTIDRQASSDSSESFELISKDDL